MSSETLLRVKAHDERSITPACLAELIGGMRWDDLEAFADHLEKIRRGENRPSRRILKAWMIYHWADMQ